MSFPAYDEYKDSSVAWLGEVPSHWSVERIANLYREAVEAGNDDLPILSVSIHSGVSDDELAPDEVERKVSRSEDRSKYKQVQPNDLVYNMMRAWQGGFGAVRAAGMVSPAYVVARPKVDVPSKYVELLLRTPGAVEEMRRRSRGVTDFRLRLYWDEFKDMRIALPPEHERNRIVAFLNRETAKIDALVAEQKRLIALLKKKRQAVISHAVTKGLNPDAPLKDSGIEWLGQIPAHWDLLPLTRVVARFVDYRGATPTKVDDGVPLITATQIKHGRIDHSLDPVFISEDEYATRMTRGFPERGDLLLTTEAPLGECALIEYERVAPGQRIILMKMERALMSSRYLHAHFRSQFGQAELWTRASGSTASGIRADRLRASNVLVPPLDEQATIVDHISEVTSSYDQLFLEAQSAIVLLQERRAALISAAVTGKIDVRGAVGVSNVVALPTKTNAAALPSSRAVVGAYAIRCFGQMGRMAVMKVGYLAQAHVRVHELAGTYERYAAGPYDSDLIDAMERGAANICGITTVEPSLKGDAVRYVTPTNQPLPSDALELVLGTDRSRAFLGLINLLKGLSREGVEAIATLYAVWNDLIASGRDVTDDAICGGVFDWHPEKREKFGRDTLENWLGWMRRNGVVPDGSAPRTDHQGDLFA